MPDTPLTPVSTSHHAGRVTGTARISWWALLVLSALAALNHFVLIFAEDNMLAFGAFAGLNALATVVLWFGYREKGIWAWWGIWFEILSLALVAIVGDPTNSASDSGLQIAYGVVAGVMAVAQFGTLKSFK